MLRRVSRWGVTALGVVLAICGVVAMVGGWDIIQVERGWSLFIGGATALAGGAVVIALGQVVFRLDEILDGDAVASHRGKIARAFRPRRQAATKRAGAAFETAVAASAPGASANARPNAARSTSAARGRPARSSGEGAGARSRGARGRRGERRRASRGRPLQVRRHHLRDVLGRRGGSPDIERRAALRFPRGASRASRAAILSRA